MSRIYYDGKFYDYPLKATNALKNLGIWESTLCVLSYIWVRINPPKDQTNFEGWTASRFGWRLYKKFFKTYTEKVWGIPAEQIQADWAAQRIKNLSLFKAILNAVFPPRKQKEITSLIEEFEYPKFGPGMMWEKCHELVRGQGSQVLFEHKVNQFLHKDGKVVSVQAATPDGLVEFDAESVISSMPLPHLLQAMSPPASEQALRAATSLNFRDFLTVALIVPEVEGFPDNWIYIHSEEVRVGRVQNFGQWSPYLVKGGRTCLGLEYFVNIGDDLWNSNDEALVAIATKELGALGLVDPGLVEGGYVVRMPRAYPMYDNEYQENVEIIRSWLNQHAKNVYPVGRNGMHRYNNQDHSMLTAMLSVENICGASHDIWQVNVEEDYHEEISK
tara:strand:- start:140 stop:1303 length:1164 start_codon:yes stop_codon:yes gene_type:complete